MAFLNVQHGEQDCTQALLAGICIPFGPECDWECRPVALQRESFVTQVYELMVPLDKPGVLEKTLDVLAQFATAIRYPVALAKPYDPGHTL